MTATSAATADRPLALKATLHCCVFEDPNVNLLLVNHARTHVRTSARPQGAAPTDLRTDNASAPVFIVDSDKLLPPGASRDLNLLCALGRWGYPLATISTASFRIPPPSRHNAIVPYLVEAAQDLSGLRSALSATSFTGPTSRCSSKLDRSSHSNHTVYSDDSAPPSHAACLY